MITVSLVIPAYNEEKYLSACLEYATRGGRGKLLEIIVVDNASTDRTGAIAAAIEGVRVVREEKKGPSHARQRGFMEARGEVVAYIDADTRMPEGWCEKVIAAFESDPKMVLLSGPYYFYDLSDFRNLLVSLWYRVGYLIYLGTGYMATAGNFAIRKTALEQMKGFDTSIEFYGDDTNLARRAHAVGRVKFDMDFVMFTSGRRLKGQGFFKTAGLYGVNFFSEVLFRRPASKKYTDIR